MGRSKRALLATAEETSSPPPSLPSGHTIAQVIKAEGTYLYSVHTPSKSEPLLVELPSRFRSQIWIKRGGYVVVNTLAFDDRDNKLDGEIANIVRNEREWRKYSYWSKTFLSKFCYLFFDNFNRPQEFEKKSAYPEDSEEDESVVGKLPPSEDADASV